MPHRWRDRYAKLGDGLKIGIASHRERSYTRRRRSTELAQWGSIFKVPGVHFVNLQYGDCTAELAAAKSLGVTIHRWPDVNPLKDLDDFAAQFAGLDLVISVDRATVHMAGALGVPVWTLLHFAANWRWLLDRDDTPWYPSMRLARQPEFGRWAPVFESVAEAWAPGDIAGVEDGLGAFRRAGAMSCHIATRPALRTTDGPSVKVGRSAGR